MYWNLQSQKRGVPLEMYAYKKNEGRHVKVPFPFFLKPTGALDACLLLTKSEMKSYFFGCIGFFVWVANGWLYEK